MADGSLIALRMRLTGGKQVAAEADAAATAIGKTGAAAETASKKGASATARLAKTATSLKTVGRGLTTYVSLPVAGVATAAGVMALDFDRSMRNVNSIAQLPEKRFMRLKQQVLDLAGPTAQAPKTLSEGLYDLVSSGFDADEGMKVLRASALAASAGLTTTEVSTKAVAAVINAYSLKADDAGSVSDTLFETVNRGVLTFEELASTIGDVLPFAAQLGINLNEVGASVSTMTKGGLSAPESMTRLKNAMVTLIKPGKALSERLDDIGMSGEELVKKKGFQGAIEEIIRPLHGNKEGIAALFPNIRALGGVLSLTGINAKRAAGDLEAFKDTTGATNTVLKEQEKSFGFQLQRAWAELQKVLIELGQKILPIVVPFMVELADGVKSAVTWFEALPEPLQKVLGYAGGLAALAGPILLFAGNVAKAATSLGLLKTAEGGGLALNKGGLLKGASGLLGASAVIAGQSGVGGKAGEVAGNIGGGALMGFSVGGPWGAAIGGGLGAAVSAIPLITGLFDSHKVDKLKAQTEHLKTAMDEYRQSIKGVKAGEEADSRAKHRLRAAHHEEATAAHHLAEVLAHFGVNSRQAHTAQVKLAKAERGVTAAAKAEERAHRLSGNRLQLYRIKSLQAVASIKQSLPVLRRRITSLNQENRAGKLSQQGLERLVKMEGRLETAKTQLTSAYAKAENLAGKPWAKRLESLTELQAQYGRQGKTLVKRMDEQREHMQQLKAMGLTQQFREENTELQRQVGLYERLVETSAQQGGNLGKTHPPVPHTKHHAAGTWAAPAGLSLVGEGGAELMDVPQGARILGASKTRDVLGTLAAAAVATRAAGSDGRAPLVHATFKVDRKVLVDAVVEGIEDAEARR